MTPIVLLLLVFYLGLVAGALRVGLNFKQVGELSKYAALVTLGTPFLGPGAFIVAPLAPFVTFIVLGARKYNKHFRPRINEGSVLWLSISFLYFLLSIKSEFLQQLLSFSTLPISLVVFSSFTNFRLNRLARVAMSIWFSLMLLVLEIYQVRRLFEQRPDESLWMYIDFFFLAGTMMTIFVNLCVPFGIVSTREDQEFSIKENFARMAYRISPQSLPLFLAMVVFLVTALPLYLNFKLEFLPPGLWLSINLFLVPLILELIFRYFPYALFRVEPQK